MLFNKLKEFIGGGSNFSPEKETPISEYADDHLLALALESEDLNLRLQALKELGRRQKLKQRALRVLERTRKRGEGQEREYEDEEIDRDHDYNVD